MAYRNSTTLDTELLVKPSLTIRHYHHTSVMEKTTRSSPHHVAQHRPTGSETTPPYASQSSRFGSEPPSVEDDVDVSRCAILELHARNDDDDQSRTV